MLALLLMEEFDIMGYYDIALQYIRQEKRFL